MKTLIVEDDFAARKFLESLLADYGHCDIAVDGEEGVNAFLLAWKEKAPYDLICMDIMMPIVDGQEALEQIRAIEKDMGLSYAEEVKVIMTTALGDPHNVIGAYRKGGATKYLVKPINKQDLDQELKSMKLAK